MSPRRLLQGGILSAVAAAAAAQQLGWQVPAPPSTITYLYLAEFGDLDGDGVRDVAVVGNDRLTGISTVQIRSSIDGGILANLTEVNLSYTIAHAGDMDRDGRPDLAVRWDWGNGVIEVFIRSIATGQTLWSRTGTWAAQYADRMLGDLDTNGDGRPDLVVSYVAMSNNASGLFVYDHTGALLYTKDFYALGRIVISLAKMGDMNGDGCDDFLVGSNDITGRGALDIVSGIDGTFLLTTHGLAVGDALSDHVGNMGDIDGDGVNDFAGFPYWAGTGFTVVAFSGATGAVIRTWAEYGNSGIVGGDHDQDGLGDMVVGADWPVWPPNYYGSTRCYSSRDGALLWKVDNTPIPGSGSSGWMEYSANIGPRPGSPYPAIAWLDTQWYTPGTDTGRVRVYDPMRAGQGPVTGTACTSTGTLPLIGVRPRIGGSRITIAKSHPNALAALWLSINPLPQPIDLSPFGVVGCSLYVAADATFLRTLGTTGIDRGYAQVDLPFQLAQAGFGLAAVAQWLVYDFATGDHATTQMHGIRLQ